MKTLEEDLHYHGYYVTEAMTRDDILKGAEPDACKRPIKERSQGYRYRFDRVLASRENNEVVVKYVCSSVGHPVYNVYIALDDFWTLWDANESSESKVDLNNLVNTAIMQGDIRCSCTCPAWIYSGMKYIATQLEYAYGSEEKRYPRVRNPHLKGTVCKHLYIVLKALPFQKFGIASGLKSELKRLKVIQ